MGLSLWQILIVVLLVVVLFGRGKISSLMTDMAQGIKAFKKGMKEEEDTSDTVTEKVISDQSTQETPTTTAKTQDEKA